MSVNYEYGTCPAYIAAKEHDEDSPEWRKFASLAESLIWALLVTGFPPKSEWAITDDNWREVFTRLSVLEKANGSYRAYHRDKAEGGVKRVYFTPSEIVSMIGLRVNAGNKTKAEFKKTVMTMLEDHAAAALRNWQSDLEQECA